MNLKNKTIAIIGAGPAGIAAAGYLADAGIKIALINRDIRPGGLVEYGIYFRKHIIKEAFRKQFISTLAKPNIRYYGNLIIGQNKPISIEHLKKAGFDAILIATGAQNTKYVGLPNETAAGVFHAKDITFYYNSLPGHGNKHLNLGPKIILIGLGNVMIDIARYLIHEEKVDQIITTARRGPSEVKFTQKEWLTVANNLDKKSFEAEMEQCEPIMEAVKQNYQEAYQKFFKSIHKAYPKDSETKLSFDFFAQPKQIVLDKEGKVKGLEIVETELILQKNGYMHPQETGTVRTIPADQIIFCVGDGVDMDLGLPLDKQGEFITNQKSSYQDNEIIYQLAANNQNIFVAGWARKPSKGLAGQAKKDGIQAARTIEKYLLDQSTSNINTIEKFESFIKNQIIITKEDWMQLIEIENQLANIRGLPFFRFSSNEDMLRILKKKH